MQKEETAMIAILTKYHPRTATLPGRVSAWANKGHKFLLADVPNTESQHRLAATRLCRAAGWHTDLIQAALPEGGANYVFLTKEGATHELT